LLTVIQNFGLTTVEWTWWRHHRNANGYSSVILAPIGTVHGCFG